MYHCHVEDVEHVQMGMTGMIFVRPRQNGNTSLFASGKYAYNDGDGSTGYDREFAMFMSEVWAEAHWADAHIQLPEWSDYRADFALLNGRVYPDTLEPSTVVNPYAERHVHAVRCRGATCPIPARPELRYQPLSSLVTCNAGERVLLRFANLGFKQQTMTLTGLRAHDRRQGRHPAARPHRGGRLLRHRLDHHRGRRERRRHLHRAAPLRGIRARHLPALQPRVPALEQPRAPAASAGRRPRSACTRPTR